MAARTWSNEKTVKVTSAAIVVGGVVVGSSLLAALTSRVWWLHRLTPSPDGLVFQVELREATPSFSRDFLLAPVDRGGPAIAILERGGQPGTTSARFRGEFTIVRYPTGEVLEHVTDPPTAFRDEVFTARRAARGFDFDGDGVDDRTDCPDRGWCCVRSGVDDRVLWEDRDPLEYEWQDRLTRLGDLDLDGFAELAVLHPRQDRSDYDLEPLDRLFGAKSWVSIVSGARIARRAD